jgi:hypothetical protein
LAFGQDPVSFEEVVAFHQVAYHQVAFHQAAYLELPVVMVVSLGTLG